jgi:hypothetical protein
MKNFSENWDGINRKAVDEAKDPTAKQIKALRLSSEKGKTKQGKNADIMTAKDDAIKESTMTHFTELDKAAKDIIAVSKTLKGKKNLGGFTPEQAELVTIAHALVMEGHRMQDFFKGLIYNLEAVHKKAMSPSKHGNMEIMRDIQTVIRELKKYQR